MNYFIINEYLISYTKSIRILQYLKKKCYIKKYFAFWKIIISTFINKSFIIENNKKINKNIR